MKSGKKGSVMLALLLLSLWMVPATATAGGDDIAAHHVPVSNGSPIPTAQSVAWTATSSRIREC